MSFSLDGFLQETDFTKYWLDKAGPNLVLHKNTSILPNWLAKIFGQESTCNLTTEIKEKMQRNIDAFSTALDKEEQDDIKKEINKIITIVSKIKDVGGIKKQEKDEFFTNFNTVVKNIFDKRIEDYREALQSTSEAYTKAKALLLQPITPKQMNELGDNLISLNEALLRSAIMEDFTTKKNSLQTKINTIKTLPTEALKQNLQRLELGRGDITEARETLYKELFGIEKQYEKLLPKEKEAQEAQALLRKKEATREQLRAEFEKFVTSDARAEMEKVKASMQPDTWYIASSHREEGYRLIQAKKTADGALELEERDYIVNEQGERSDSTAPPQGAVNFPEFKKTLDLERQKLLTIAKEKGLFVENEKAFHKLLESIKGESKKLPEEFCVIYEKEQKLYITYATRSEQVENKELIFSQNQWNVKIDPIFKPITAFLKSIEGKQRAVLETIGQPPYCFEETKVTEEFAKYQRFFTPEELKGKWIISKKSDTEYSIRTVEKSYPIHDIVRKFLNDFVDREGHPLDQEVIIDTLLRKMDPELRENNRLSTLNSTAKDRLQKIAKLREIALKETSDGIQFSIKLNTLRNSYREYPSYFSQVSLFSKPADRSTPPSGWIIHNNEPLECYIKVEGESNKIRLYKKEDNALLFEYKSVEEFKSKHKTIGECAEIITQANKDIKKFFEGKIEKVPTKPEELVAKQKALEEANSDITAFWYVQEKKERPGTIYLQQYTLSLYGKERKEYPITYNPESKKLVISDKIFEPGQFDKVMSLLAQGISLEDLNIVQQSESKNVVPYSSVNKKIAEAQEKQRQENNTINAINKFLTEKKCFAKATEDAEKELRKYQDLLPDKARGKWIISPDRENYVVSCFEDDKVKQYPLSKKTLIDKYSREDISYDPEKQIQWILDKANPSLQPGDSVSSLAEEYESYIDIVENAFPGSKEPARDEALLTSYQDIFGKTADGCYVLFQHPDDPPHIRRGFLIDDGEKKPCSIRIDKDKNLLAHIAGKEITIDPAKSPFLVSADSYADQLELWQEEITECLKETGLFSSSRPTEEERTRFFNAFPHIQTLWWIEEGPPLNYRDLDTFKNQIEDTRKNYKNFVATPQRYVLSILNRQGEPMNYAVTLDHEGERVIIGTKKGTLEVKLPMPWEELQADPHGKDIIEEFLKYIVCASSQVESEINPATVLNIVKAKQDLNKIEKSSKILEKYVTPLGENEEEIQKDFRACRDTLHTTLSQPQLFGRLYYGIRKNGSGTFDLLWQREGIDKVAKEEINLATHPGKFSIRFHEQPYNTIEEAIEAATRSKIRGKDQSLFPIKEVWDAYKRGPQEVLRLTDPEFERRKTLYQQLIDTFYQQMSAISWFSSFLPQQAVDLSKWVRDQLVSEEQKTKSTLFTILEKVNLEGKSAKENIERLAALQEKIKEDGATEISEAGRNCFICLAVLLDERISNKKIKEEFAQRFAQKIMNTRETVYQTTLNPLRREFHPDKGQGDTDALALTNLLIKYLPKKQ